MAILWQFVDFFIVLMCKNHK